MQPRAVAIIGCILTTILIANSAAQEASQVRPPVRVSWVTVTIQGTSRKGPFFASTEAVRVTRVRLAEPRSADIFDQVIRPRGFDSLDVAIPVVAFTSPDEGVDDYIHDSLEAYAHPETRFQLRSTGDVSTNGMGFVRLNAKGMLTIAGVERDVTFNVHVLRAARSLLVDGSTDLLMTDFGVTPPRGPLGMLKTDPWIRVRFYLVITVEDK